MRASAFFDVVMLGVCPFLRTTKSSRLNCACVNALYVGLHPFLRHKRNHNGLCCFVIAHYIGLHPFLRVIVKHQYFEDCVIAHYIGLHPDSQWAELPCILASDSHSMYICILTSSILLIHQIRNCYFLIFLHPFYRIRPV